MSHLKRRSGILLLIIFLLIISLFALLPRILTAVAKSSLEEAGMHVNQLVVRQATSRHTLVPRISLTSENGTSIDIEQLSINYSLSQLLSGQIDSLSIRNINVQMGKSKSDLSTMLASLYQQLGNNWRDKLPLSSVAIEEIIFQDDSGSTLLQADANMQIDDTQLKARMELQLSKGESRQIHISQQKSAIWTLQALDSDGSRLVESHFDKSQTYPLKMQINANLAQLRPWALALGFPLPARQAATQAQLQLKPDLNQHTVSFLVDARTHQLNEPEVVMQEATASISGTASFPQNNSVTVILNTDLSLSGVKRQAVAADALHLVFHSQLQLSSDGIRGRFDPGLTIDARGLQLQQAHINTAKLESVSEQQFSWHAANAEWQFDSNSLRATEVNADIGNAIKLSAGVFDLYHDTWRYPLSGKTLFELTGTASSVMQDALKLSGNTMQFSGEIDWKTTDTPLSVTTDLRLAAETVIRNNASANNASLTGRAKFVVSEESIRAEIEKSSALRLDQVHMGPAKLGSTSLHTQQPLHMLWTSSDALLAIETNTIAIQHEELELEQTTIKPGTLLVNFIDWDSNNKTLSGTISGDNIAMTATGRDLDFGKAKATFNANATTLTLAGKTTVKQTDSTLHYDVSHDIEGAHGSVSFTTDSQNASSMSRSLSNLFPHWPRELNLISGTHSLAGKANWKDADISANATINLSKIGGRYGETYFSGLESRFDLKLLPSLRGKSQFLKIKLIDIGIPVSSFSSTLSLEQTSPNKKPVITLRNTHAKLLNGNVSGNRIKLDLNRRTNNFSLSFKHVDLAELVKLHQIDGLDAIGSLSGTIPVHLGPAGISIDNGTASADKPGGNISYTPEESGNALKSASVETGLLLDVMRDFQYNQLEASGKYRPDGQLQIGLQIKGKSPHYDKNRPVHLNLNLDQNILSLLKSLRAINGLNERLDRAVQKHYKSRSR